MPRRPVLTPTCVWRISDDLVVALDQRFGEPTDAYVNGSQVWMRDDGPGGIAIEWRLHPVGGYRRPDGVDTIDVFPAVALALLSGDVPPASAESLWDGLEAFPAHGDEIEPAPLRSVAIDAVGIEPDECGLVDHQAIADDWERSRGRVSIIDRLLLALTNAAGDR
jgi:hypothetical protein